MAAGGTMDEERTPARSGRIRAVATAITVLSTALATMVVGTPPAAAHHVAVAVDIEYTPDEGGYWVLASTGAVYATGTAQAYGDVAPRDGERVASMSPTPTGNGYWIFTDTGRVSAHGDAIHHGDLDGVPLNGPVVGSIPTPSGNGYWMVAGDGGVFAFGDAGFFGSLPGVLGGLPNEPVVGMAPTPSGEGYWMVAADGGIFAFGDAAFHGSVPGVLAPGQELNQPVIGMIPQADGYLMLANDGGIFNFGVSEFHGSLGGQGYTTVVAAAVKTDRSGYLIMRENGKIHAFGSSEVVDTVPLDQGRDHQPDCRTPMGLHPSAFPTAEQLFADIVETTLADCLGRSLSYEGDCGQTTPETPDTYCSLLLISSSSQISHGLFGFGGMPCYLMLHITDGPNRRMTSAGFLEDSLQDSQVPITCS
ncbi:MAG: hypothetical protein AAGA99_26005 [Actinomycetota bacterium]